GPQQNKTTKGGHPRFFHFHPFHFQRVLFRQRYLGRGAFGPQDWGGGWGFWGCFFSPPGGKKGMFAKRGEILLSAPKTSPPIFSGWFL
ncbi:hypothetical protein DNR41_27290, partial [Escherichia coli]